MNTQTSMNSTPLALAFNVFGIEGGVMYTHDGALRR